MFQLGKLFVILQMKIDIKQGKKAIKQHFNLGEIRELKEYIGCKFEYNKEQVWMKLTQFQSFNHKFNMSIQQYKTPATKTVC